jgi:aspartate/methionine/tyrosine aminotransferase
MTSFIVMDVLERANEMEREGVHIIHLEVGEPDFDTPTCVKEAACKALEGGHTHYTHSLGLFELRDAICEYYLKTYGVSIDPDQVIVTSGSSPAIFLVFSALLEKDDQVIISDPHYACYPNFIKFVEGNRSRFEFMKKMVFNTGLNPSKKKLPPKPKRFLLTHHPIPPATSCRKAA